MGRFEKLLISVLSGSKDRDMKFTDLCKLIMDLGFSERIKGSHHIFYKEGINEILNLQPDGVNAKPYQVKQVRNIILKYKMGEIENV